MIQRQGTKLRPARRLALLAVWAAFAACAAGPAAAEVRLSAAVGFDGRIRPGLFAPVAVELVNDGGPFSGWLVVERDESSLLSALTRPAGSRGFEAAHEAAIPIDLAAGERRRVWLSWWVSQTGRPLRLTLLENPPTRAPGPDPAGGGRAGPPWEEGRIAAALDVNLRSQAFRGELILALDADGDGFGWLAAESGQTVHAADERIGVEVAYAAAPEDVPPHWSSLSAVSAIVVRGNFPLGRLDPQTLVNLEAWVHAGGRLIVTGGPRLELERSETLRRLLPAHAGGRPATRRVERLHPRLPPFEAPVTLLVWQADAGPAEEAPLWSETRRGAGSVAYLAVDPRADLPEGWAGRGDLARLMLTPASRPRLWLPGGDAVDRLAAALPAAFPAHRETLILFGGYAVAVAALLGVGRRRRLALLGVPAAGLLLMAAAYWTLEPAADRARTAGGEIRVTWLGGHGYGHAISHITLASFSPTWVALGGDRPPNGMVVSPPATEFQVTSERGYLRYTTAAVGGGSEEAALLWLPGGERVQIRAVWPEALPVFAFQRTEGGDFVVEARNDSPHRLEHVYFVHRERYIPMGEIPSGGRASARYPGRRTSPIGPGTSAWVGAAVAAHSGSRDAEPEVSEALRALTASLVMHVPSEGGFVLGRLAGMPSLLEGQRPYVHLVATPVNAGSAADVLKAGGEGGRGSEAEAAGRGL